MRSVLPAACCAFLLAGATYAAVGVTGAGVLLEPLSVRPAGLGEAYTAEGGTVEAIGYNPAGLAGLAGVEGTALVRQGFAGDTFASVLGGGTIREFGFGAGVAYLTTGSVEQIDPTGRLSTVVGQSDLVGIAGLAREVPGTPLLLGLSGTVIRSQLLEASAATDFGADFGAQVVLPRAGLRLGASLQHWGGHLRYEDARIPVDNNDLPLLVRFGAALAVAIPVGGSTIGSLESLESADIRESPPPHVGRVYADAILRRAENAVAYAGGLEYVYAGLVSLRGGYRILASGGAGRDTAWTFGAGIAFAGLRVDYAAEMLSFTALHRIGLTVSPKR